MKVFYKFASRNRPEKFISCLENIYSFSHNRDFIILASLDTNDVTMNNPEIIEKMKKYDKLIPVFGMSKNKIDAINRDMSPLADFDLLINFSDDMLFIKEGYDKIIEQEMNKYFPDGDCLLHFPDQNQGENCLTLSIMDKKYYQRFNYIYFSSYESLWADEEAKDVGKILGRYKFINQRIFNHYHPSFGQTNYDKQYLKTESMQVRERDEKIYLQRKKNNFFLNI